MLLYAHTPPPHDTCCLATKPSGILTLPCTCIMGYKDHGLQAVLIELLPYSGDGTTAATGAGSLVKPNFAPRADQTRHRQQEKWSEKGNFKGLGTDCAGTDR